MESGPQIQDMSITRIAAHRDGDGPLALAQDGLEPLQQPQPDSCVRNAPL